MAKKSQNYGVFIQGLLLVVLFTPILVTLSRDEPLEYLLPNLLLFTPFREQTKALWMKHARINRAVIREPAHVPVMDAKDYTYENFRDATDNWRHPAIVRGLFNNTPAQTKWIDPDYLPSVFGEFRLPVVKKAVYGTLQNDREIMDFTTGFRSILNDENSQAYIFFPVKSRFHYNGSDLASVQALQEKLNTVVREDLELEKRLWRGFGTKSHTTFHGAQFIMGRGSDDSEATTGTGWHCAAGTNWFVQAVGTKRWYFLDPEYSALMMPLRGGKVNMMTGSREMGKLQRHIPIRYADVQAGDLLYNPDWEWHSIKNYKGISIGCPIREFNMTLTFRNNFQYTSIVMLNKIADAFGIDIGGYPPNY